MSQLSMVGRVADECFRVFGAAPFEVCSTRPEWRRFECLDPRDDVRVSYVATATDLPALLDRPSYTVRWGRCVSPDCAGLYRQRESDEPKRWYLLRDNSVELQR